MNCSFRTYLRELIEHFPAHAMQARREWGLPGLRVAIAAYVTRFAPTSVTSPIGELATFAEFLNFLDNFCANELRCTEVEANLKSATSPVVVDVGINVGVSARWWLTLSPSVRVIGVDMVHEALEFASERITKMGFAERWTPICSAVGSKPGVARLKISDPLDGTTSLTANVGLEVREVVVHTLDELMEGEHLTKIDMLKLDIEGYAGFALEGAHRVLQKTCYVCVEGHDDGEIELSARVLMDHGFVVFKIGSRHMWWRRRG